MFSNHFATNISQIAAVKKFWKSVNIWQRYGQNFVAYFFGPPCSCNRNAVQGSLISNILLAMLSPGMIPLNTIFRKPCCRKETARCCSGSFRFNDRQRDSLQV